MRVRSGTWAWGEVAFNIIVVEAVLMYFGKKTLSEVFGDMLDNPRTRVPVLLLWVTITLHLFSRLFPPAIRKRFAPYDPIGWAARCLEKRVLTYRSDLYKLDPCRNET